MSGLEIWIVNQYAITPDQPGGSRHYELGVELAARGHRVRIFASDVNLSLRKATKLSADECYREEQRDGVTFVWVRASEYERNDWRRARNMLTFSTNLMRAADAAARRAKPDVVVGSSPHPLAALQASRMARKHRAAFVLELRDLWPQALLDMGGISPLHPAVTAMRLIERALYRRADSVVTLARGSEAYLTARGVASERIFFVPNGVHLGQHAHATDRDTMRAKLSFTRFTVVYAGAHGPANDLGVLLGAAERDAGSDYVLVGSGPAKDELVARAHDRKVANVRFLAPVPKHGVPALLAAADAGALTLKPAHAFEYAISPNKLFDYMAAPLPIVSNVPGEVATILATSRAGVTCPTSDPAAFARAVQEIRALAPEDRAAMAHRGRAFVEAHYDRRKLVDDLERAIGSARKAMR